MNSEEIKEYLDFKSKQYNTTKFIKTDPIQIPHSFSKKEDMLNAYQSFSPHFSTIITGPK